MTNMTPNQAFRELYDAAWEILSRVQGLNHQEYYALYGRLDRAVRINRRNYQDGVISAVKDACDVGGPVDTDTSRRKQADEPDDDDRPGSQQEWRGLVPSRAMNALVRNNVTSLEALASMTESDLLSMKGIGRSSVDAMKSLLGRYGLSLRVPV